MPPLLWFTSSLIAGRSWVAKAVFRGVGYGKFLRSSWGCSGDVRFPEIRCWNWLWVLFGARFVALQFVDVASIGSLRQGQAEEGPKRSPARSPLGAGFPANKASSRLACPVVEAARAGAAGQAKCPRLPPHPLQMPVQPIAGRCGWPEGSGWLDGALVHPGGRVRVVLRGIVCGPAAGDARDGEATPALAAYAAGHPARLRAGSERESPGRKPAHQVRPLVTSSLDHAKLLKTPSSRRTPSEQIPHA